MHFAQFSASCRDYFIIFCHGFPPIFVKYLEKYEKSTIIAIVCNAHKIYRKIQQVFPKLTLGTWTYLFQGLLICILMIMRKKFVPSYLFSFVVGFAFGEMMDLHELWITRLPLNIPLRILYFVLSYIIICFGIALSNRCKLPIIPTDLFPREVSEITKVPYARIKIGFDVTCLAITACMTFFCLGHIMGLGIGTIVAAFTMGKGIAIIGNWMDRHVGFVSILQKDEA